jgi:hypothetical protein
MIALVDKRFGAGSARKIDESHEELVKNSDSPASSDLDQKEMTASVSAKDTVNNSGSTVPDLKEAKIGEPIILDEWSRIFQMGQ